jgi:hypothetical protein
MEMRNAVPDSAVSQKITEYVEKNYSPSFVTNWEKETVGQSVELIERY